MFENRLRSLEIQGQAERLPLVCRNRGTLPKVSMRTEPGSPAAAADLEENRPPAPQPSLRPVVLAYHCCYLPSRRSRQCLAQLPSKLPSQLLRVPKSLRPIRRIQPLTPALTANHKRQTVSFHTLADSLSLRKTSTPLQLSKSELSLQNTGGGCISDISIVASRPVLAPFCRPFIFMVLRIAFPATPFISQPSELPPVCPLRTWTGRVVHQGHA